jgi:protein-S-isoprenylcysteine O-methyltransferase Ste14
MTPQDDNLWRGRFVTVNLVRIGGTAVVLLGLAIWYSNLVRPGGAPLLGFPLALIGLVASFWGPIALSRHWKRKDGR